MPLLERPPVIERPKRIHPRHILPFIGEGPERNVHSVSGELRFDARAARPMAAGDEIKLVLNTELTQPGQNRTASNVDEPSCAISGQTVLYTGNWYAAISTDGGRSFRYMDPATAFHDAQDGPHFCCDQVAHYIASLDLFVWLLQYDTTSGVDNFQRLAFASPADAVQGRWRLFDITTDILGVPGTFLDFPDIATAENFLYVTTNIFGPGREVGSAVVRIPYASIESGRVAAQPFVSRDYQSFRVAQYCGRTAYFAAHANTSTLAVFRWPEAAAQPAPADVGVARWIGGNGYVSRTPDGNRWLDRADPRITGATLVGNEVWFCWGVDSRSNHRARPFVQIARIKTSDLSVIENVNVFDPESATCYGALSTNDRGEVGISYMIGGGPRHPSHMVGILTGNRQDLLVKAGERSPRPDNGKGEWGDYLTMRPVFPGRRLFAATGYTMLGAGTGSNRDVTPRFAVFGRARDVPAGVPVVPAVPPLEPDALTTPFSDVNALPTVSAEVAAAVKAACVAEGQKSGPMGFEMPGLRLVTKPGVERWPVKTGTDQDVGLVGKNVVDGQKLGAGIVEATIEELNQFLRPPDMRPADKLFPRYQARRRAPVEFTVWRIECDVIALKLEGDGDYHLVLQGASGKMMIAEVPTPKPPFVEAQCPWLQNMKDAREAIDNKLVAPLSPHDFVQLGETLVPRQAAMGLAIEPRGREMRPQSFATPESYEAVDMPTFQAQVKPTRARITGVGFFDKVHGQTGVAPNGIELHPILKVEWI